MVKENKNLALLLLWIVVKPTYRIVKAHWTEYL